MPRLVADHHEDVYRGVEEADGGGARRDAGGARQGREDLIRHAQAEEEVLYPAALLVGKLVTRGLGVAERDRAAEAACGEGRRRRPWMVGCYMSVVPQFISPQHKLIQAHPIMRENRIRAPAGDGR